MARLTNAQKQEILDWFDEFVDTIDQRLDAWLKTVPAHQHDKLVKTPESLPNGSLYKTEKYANRPSSGKP